MCVSDILAHSSEEEYFGDQLKWDTVDHYFPYMVAQAEKQIYFHRI